MMHRHWAGKLPYFQTQDSTNCFPAVEGRTKYYLFLQRSSMVMWILLTSYVFHKANFSSAGQEAEFGELSPQNYVRREKKNNNKNFNNPDSTVFREFYSRYSPHQSQVVQTILTKSELKHLPVLTAPESQTWTLGDSLPILSHLK